VNRLEAASETSKDTHTHSRCTLFIQLTGVNWRYVFERV